MSISKKDFSNFLLLSWLFSFTIAVELTSLSAGTTFNFIGNAANDNFGYSVSSAGDFNKDGYEDILIGAYQKNMAYVIYGGEKSTLFNIDLSLTTSLDPLTTGFSITGQATGDFFGMSVSSAGDIDKDGYDDILIGAAGRMSAKGAVYVIYGGPKSSHSDLNLQMVTTLNPSTTGFVISGGGAGDYFGNSVSSAGDINKDGYDDIIVGAYGRNNFQGAAYVIYGGPRPSRSNIDLATLPLIPTSTGFSITGSATDDRLGSSVSSAGDINKDDYDDIIIGAYGKSSFQGAAYVIYGREKSLMSNRNLATQPLDPATTGFMITGSSASYLGWSVSSAGDINGDQYDDFIIGAYRVNGGQGAAYVFYGKDNSFASNINIAASAPLNPVTTGFTIIGKTAGDNLGVSVSGGRDINQDGIKDIVVGTLKGKAYVVYGKTSGHSNIDLSSSIQYPATTGFMIQGDATSQFGKSVAMLDFNGDGFSDVLVGAPSTASAKGAAYLMIYNECPQDCKKCSSTSTCTECNGGYALEQSLCRECPSNCDSCSTHSSCDACTAPYMRFQGQCLISCPASTFSTVDNICISCPAGCTQCTSDSYCQECADGYTISDSNSCVLPQQTAETPKPPEEKKGEKATAGTFEGTSLIGSALTSGSSLPLNFGMVAKILRNVKYMNLTVSPELTKTFYSWKVASGFMSAPKSWNSKSESKEIPIVFSRYGLSPIFLINFWKPFVMSLIGMAVFAVFKAIEMVLAKNNGPKTMLISITKQVNIAASNFALTQFYSNLDDLLLYFIIEMRSSQSDTGFRVFSTLLAVTLFIVGGLFIGLHAKLLSNYQNLKSQKPQLEGFVAKYENIRLIMRDFKDITLLTQSFLLVNLIRSVVASFIFAVLFDYPFIQITLLSLTNFLMIAYLLAMRPFKELFDTCGQLFCEVVLFIANICVFILAGFGHAESYPIDSVKRASQCIIVLNYILLLGCAVLLVINIGKIVYTSYKEGTKKTRAVTPATMTESAVRIMPSMMNQSEMGGQSNFPYEKNPLETVNNDDQILGFSHRVPINYEAQNENIVVPEPGADWTQSNVFSGSNIIYSQQFLQERRNRKVRINNQRRAGMEASYEGPESRMQDFSGVLSQDHTNRMDMNLVNLDAVPFDSHRGMSGAANFMPIRKIGK